MSKTQILMLGFIGFIILLVVMFKMSYWQQDIENDLTERSIQALHNQQLDWAKVDFKQRGRDARLHGQAPSEQAAKQAEQIIARLYGVRMVDNQLEINPTNPLIKSKHKPNNKKYQETNLITNQNQNLETINLVEHQKLEPINNQINTTKYPQNKLLAVEHKQPENSLRTKIKTCQKRFNLALSHRPIQFYPNNSITQDSFPVLQQLLTAALSCPDLRIKIIGRAYQYHNPQDNLQQSLIYAQVVAYLFQQGGIPAKRLLIFGAGAEQPIGSDAFNPKIQRTNIKFQVISPF